MQNKSKLAISQKQAVLLAVLALFMIACGIYAGKNWEQIFGNKPAAGMLDLDPNAGKLSAAQNPQTNGNESQNIQIPGYESIQVIDGNTLNVTLENPEGNPCYFRFRIFTEEAEQLYQSGLVPPGEGIPRPQLYKKLAAGSENVIIQIETYSLAGQTPMNGAAIQTILEIGTEK